MRGAAGATLAPATYRLGARAVVKSSLLTATRDGASSSYRVDRARLRDALQGAHDALLPVTTGS